MDDNFLWLNTDGTIVPESESTRALFGGQQLRFKLQPTSPNILLAVRAPCEQLPVVDGRVVLSGDLAGFPLVDLIVSLNQCRISGILRIFTPGVDRSLTFLEGELCMASSSLAAEKIGEVAVRMGLVTREALDEMLTTKKGTGRIGNMMVEHGLLPRHALYDCLRHQVTEIFMACLMLHEGVFTLTNQKIGSRQSLNINTQGLLMDSVRQLDEMKEFQKVIPSPQCCPRAVRPVDEKLSTVEDHLLILCDGTHSITELSKKLKLSEFDTTKTIFHLVEMGYVDREMPMAGNGGALPTAEMVIDVFNKVFSMIFLILRDLPNPPDAVGETTNALWLQSELFPVFRGIQLNVDGTIPKAKMMKNIQEQGGETPELVKTIYSTFSDLMYFLLFEVSEQLDSATDEQLSAKIKTFLEPLEAVVR